jgi:CDP-diacylglycerol--glycerol-3-phosphate 3-phosphatidyltransferase
MRGDLVFLLAVLGFALGTMLVFRVRYDRSAVDPLESSARGTFVLGPFVRSWFLWFIGPGVRVAVRIGLSPTFFNIAGAALGAASGVAFGFGNTILGGWLILLGGASDVFDGRVARAQGVASPKGAFLDSSLDRFAEVGAFAGLAVYYQGQPLMAMLVALALGGSLLVSYTRARGESQGVVCKVGVMQRAERLLLLGFSGLLDSSMAGWLGQPEGVVLGVVVGVIAVGTVATAIYRTVWIAARLPDA